MNNRCAECGEKFKPDDPIIKVVFQPEYLTPSGTLKMFHFGCFLEMARGLVVREAHTMSNILLEEVLS